MPWMITITVGAFLLGDPAVIFNGFWKDRFPTFQACDDFLKSNDKGLLETEEELTEIARKHAKDPTADVLVEFKCTPAPESGEPV